MALASNLSEILSDPQILNSLFSAALKLPDFAMPKASSLNRNGTPF